MYIKICVDICAYVCVCECVGLRYYDSYNKFITKYLRNKLNSLTPLTKLEVKCGSENVRWR